eukprot:SAG31_NODE_9957_length_1205_cov_2.201627_1_plen_200_part_10
MMHLISETGQLSNSNLPYGGDIQAATRAQDRPALRILFEARQARENPHAAPPKVPSPSTNLNSPRTAMNRAAGMESALPGALNSSAATEISPMLQRTPSSHGRESSGHESQSIPTLSRSPALNDPLDAASNRSIEGHWQSSGATELRIGNGFGQRGGLMTMNHSSMLDHTASTEPDVSFGSAYQSKLPSVHHRSYSMPPG